MPAAPLDLPPRPDADASAAPAAPDTACAHCGLPVGTHPVGAPGGPAFCCSGCEIVYETLHTSGLGDTYYRLSDIAEDKGRARPADTATDDLVLSELDSDAYLDEHTTLHDDGTRSGELFLDGVHCAACVWLIERAPRELAGVVEATLDLPRARLRVRWNPEAIALPAIARWTARFGYTAHPVRHAESTRRTDAERRLLVKVGVTWALAGNIMLLAFALYSGLNLADDPAMAGAARWLSMLLAFGALLYGGAEFVQRAWQSVRLAWRRRDLRALHMDTPIALGLVVGFGDSTWATVTGTGEVWFDSITVLTAALLTARWLQLRSRRLAGDATERLLALIPSMVRRVTGDGATETVRVDEIDAGDVVLVPAGEVVPVDGLVADGASTVNNAVLTGESRPEPVAPGAAVTAGATNLTAPLRVMVQAAGTDTRVGQLLAWVRDAAGSEARVVRLADRLSGYFVLAVGVLALATAALWAWLDPSMAAQHVIALLVITCPCALGMATPLAMAVAAGKAARAGLFIKSEAATQHLAAVDTLVLDKTGTLTEGAMSVVRADGDAEAIRRAAVLEAHSHHPIAQALVQAYGVCRLDGADGAPDDGRTAEVEVVSGAGVRGMVDGHALAVGRPAWIAAQTGGLGPFEGAVTAVAADGHTPVAVAQDGAAVALLALGDRLRDDAAGVLAGFADAGLDVYLCSGDHPHVVAAVARQLGLDAARAHGHVSPEAKRAFVGDLQAEGRTVAMVGDGVNDAAALQAADVGVAVYGGATASLVAADVFLTRDGVEPLADLLDGAGHVMRVIRRNLGLSLLYNVVGAGLAVAGLVSPLVAAIAMPISSLVVVASSILQRPFPERGAARARAAATPAAPAPRQDRPAKPYTLARGEGARTPAPAAPPAS